MNNKVQVTVNTELIDNIILDMLLQCCSSPNNNYQIDNQCLSCFEDACDYLTEQGYMTTVNGRIYILTKKGRDAI